MTSYSIKTLNLNLNSAEALGLNFAETQGEFIIFTEYSDTGEAGDAKVFLLAKPFSDSSSVSDVSDILLGKALSETIDRDSLAAAAIAHRMSQSNAA